MAAPQRSTGPYPPGLMRLLAGIGVTVGPLLIAAGAVGFSSRPGRLLVIGIVAVLFFPVMIPLAKRRGRM